MKLTDTERARIAWANEFDPTGEFAARNRHLLVWDTERLVALREKAGDNTRLCRRIDEVLLAREGISPPVKRQPLLSVREHNRTGGGLSTTSDNIGYVTLVSNHHAGVKCASE